MIRWKPHSEGDGNLVILTNEPFVLLDGGQMVSGTNYGPSNGYRYTVRYPKPGSAYRSPQIKTRGGVYSVPNPGRNYGGGRGPELVRGGGVSGGGDHRQNLERIVAQGGGREEVQAYLRQNGLRPSDVAVPAAVAASQSQGGSTPSGLGYLVPKEMKGKAWEAVKGLLPNSTKMPPFMANAVYGTSTNAIPGAVGSYKGPAAFASQGGSQAVSAPTSVASQYGFGPMYNNALIPQSAGTSASMLANFAPWLAGGAAALGIWAGRENPVERWKGITSRYEQLGRQGGVRPTSDFNHFGLNSIKQDAYDAGKAGKAYTPGKYSNAAAAAAARREEAKLAAIEQGFSIADIRSRSNGSFTQKEKAAAALQRRHQTSQTGGNSYLLTDADKGGK